MYANVVVLTYQPPQIKSYTYEIPKVLQGKVQIGQLVEVPFGKRTPLGIIIRTSNTKPSYAKASEGESKLMAIKSISAIITQAPILLPYQVKLLGWLSFYYHAPMVNCLEAILPKLPSKQFTAFALSSGRGVHSSQQIANQSVNRQPSTVNQTLVLVPSINRIPETLAQFPEAKNYALYHNQLKISEKFATWLKIKNGQVDFIFGARNAIFSPCPRLSKVVIFDEHDLSFKDERSPYFDTLTIAEKLQELTGATIQIIDSSPKISTYFTHKDEIKTPKLSRPKVQIISMVEEKNALNYSPISQPLAIWLAKISQRRGRSLLFLNKKAESGQIYCKNCRFQKFAKAKPISCPNCGSETIWFYSLNIATLANAARQLIPKANINLIAEGIRNPPTDDRQPTIDIATSYIFYAQTYQKYDLVAHVAVDSVTNIADFTSSEKAFCQITDLKKLTKQNGLLILQTYNPESDLIGAAAQNHYAAFYQKNLKERKALAYPPFALLVKLTIRGKSKDKIADHARNLALRLKETLAGVSDNDLYVLGPYQPFFFRKIPSYNIILKKRLKKYDLGEREKAIGNLAFYFEKLSRDWQVIIEPASLN